VRWRHSCWSKHQAPPPQRPFFFSQFVPTAPATRPGAIAGPGRFGKISPGGPQNATVLSWNRTPVFSTLAFTRWTGAILNRVLGWGVFMFAVDFRKNPQLLWEFHARIPELEQTEKATVGWALDSAAGPVFILSGRSTRCGELRLRFSLENCVLKPRGRRFR